MNKWITVFKYLNIKWSLLSWLKHWNQPCIVRNVASLNPASARIFSSELFSSYWTLIAQYIFIRHSFSWFTRSRDVNFAVTLAHLGNFNFVKYLPIFCKILLKRDTKKTLNSHLWQVVFNFERVPLWTGLTYTLEN